ncbi:MAG TPA: alpha/beta hydrolase [Candidatus Dormibacteraeota bacterium]|nr:alpha/beta hydrolase [Candidatus Dormibacteraeota bacterium]
MVSSRVKERAGIERDVLIEFGKVKLEATLNRPEMASGIVLFAHGSGSSRFSPRNRYVAGVFQSHGIATLLLDLLTADEETIDQRTSQLRFNIPLLAKRLAGATSWTLHQPDLRGLEVGYFGASTGAAAALLAAARIPGQIAAVVSRGGRPDLAGESLGSVQAPTLLIVGGNDRPVIELNQQALAELHCMEKKLVIIPGATHLFEEPGKLEEVAAVAAEWFSTCFILARQSRPEQGARH